MKISEVLNQPTVELKDGDILAPVTRSEGYVPTFKDSTNIVKGKYLYKVVGVGEVDGVTGKHMAFNIVPIVLNEDHTAYVDDLENPVALQEAGKITHMIGRNHPVFKDGYQDRHFVEITGIPSGEEHRELLVAFIDFVNSEFSLGVNDFTLESPEYLGA